MAQAAAHTTASAVTASHSGPTACAYKEKLMRMRGERAQCKASDSRPPKLPPNGDVHDFYVQLP